MAKQRASSNQSSSRNQRASSNQRSSGNRRASSNGRLSPAKVIRQARDQMGELTGRTVESVLGFHHDDDDGGWEVLVEVVEMRRVPSTTDVLGSYLLTLDEDGDIQEYRRTRRYHRNQVEEGQS